MYEYCYILLLNFRLSVHFSPAWFHFHVFPMIYLDLILPLWHFLPPYPALLCLSSVFPKPGFSLLLWTASSVASGVFKFNQSVQDRFNYVKRAAVPPPQLAHRMSFSMRSEGARDQLQTRFPSTAPGAKSLAQEDRCTELTMLKCIWSPCSFVEKIMVQSGVFRKHSWRTH